VSFVCNATSSYRAAIKKLKKPYPEIEECIKREFKGLEFGDVFNKNYVIQDSGVAKIIKVRVSYGSKGKSGGFRLILIVNAKTSTVTFLYVFPKTGKYGRENISNDELRSLLDEYKVERQRESLSIVEFNA